MATLLLQAAGSLVGAAIGGPFGAIAGGLAGALAGSVADRQIFGSATNRNVEGPRLADLVGVSSTEGAAIPRVYGRARVGGQAIWATHFEEVVSVERERTGGGKGGRRSTTTTTTYSYFVNIAIGLCEGPVAFVRRVWADGKEIDLTLFNHRLYRGDETQTADPLIAAKEGAGGAPAYRGLAYIVFERMALADFGNRVPQFSFEVVRPIAGLAKMIRGVDLIPGATEFGYQTTLVTATPEEGVTHSENRHQLQAPSDWTASLDALQALCPNLVSVALVVAWFGDDLRCGACTVAPRVEQAAKTTNVEWSVAGLARGDARVVSLSSGAPAYGGTPSDAAVISAIGDLKARGLFVTLYPFVMMDVPAGNALADPWSGAASQPAYPWRGRIVCDPAPGRAGSPDGAAAAGTQVAAFFGSASPDPSEWSFRRFVLHCASLCVAAGGVNAFLVGSELAALTRVRSASGVYPAANALATLAADVKALLGAATKISYAADWTEYGAHALAGGELRFPLDVVWSSPSVDFVGVDVYWPLSDWRDGTTHADAAETRSVYDRAYLARRVARGEGYDWFYASPADRLAQIRTPIADGAYGKPWVYRVKDLVGWWSNAHRERVGGVELASATAWTPQGKPIWLTEIGCPAVDRGANMPNVFPDPKSSESALPFASRGFRDDLMQIAALEAIVTHFDPAQPGHVAGDNPLSALYGGRMVDPARIHVWAWDARPFPAFPAQSPVWADAANWDGGHWITGRVEGAPLDALIAAVLDDAGIAADLRETPRIDGYVEGYTLDRVMAPRAAIEPLAALFGIVGRVASGRIGFLGREAGAGRALGDDDLVPDKSGETLRLSRADETDLPCEARVEFADGETDYRRAAVASRRLEGASSRVRRGEVAAAMRRAEAQRLADVWLRDLWIARETAQFSLRPGLVDVEIGDAVTLIVDGAERLYRIEKIADGDARRCEARAFEPAIFDAPPPRIARPPQPAPRLPGKARVAVLDLAIARGDQVALQYVGAFADPWPGPLALWRSAGTTPFELIRLIDRAAVMGTTLTALAPGPVARFDRAASLDVRLQGGAPQSVSDAEMLAGANAAAIRGVDGAWEIFSFARADLVADRTWRLSRLLRGLGGEEALAQRLVLPGATIVLLDGAVVPLASGLAQLGASWRWRIGPASRDHSDASYVEFVANVTGKALTPFAPVRMTATRGAGGVTLSFLRRGRIDSDAWQPVDIPLGEDRESYEVEILAGSVVKRVIAANAPTLLYAAADELADFGAPQSALSLRACQMSAVVGRGFPLEAVVAVG